MKSGNYVYILAIILMIACFVMPVMADNNSTKDAATVLYNRGEILLSTGDYQNAVATYNQALASNLTNMKMGDGLLYLYRDKGYALIQLNRTDEAIQTLDEGLALYGNDAMLWNNKGYALAKQGKLQDALSCYNNALTYDQNFTTALNNKGDLLFQTGQFQSAVDAYSKVLLIDPGNSYATNGLALAQKAAASMISPALVILVIVLIAIAGGGVWHFKFRKPADENPTETKKAQKGKK